MNGQKTPVNQNIKLDPIAPLFNAKFYYNDGIFYYHLFVVNS